MTEADEGERNGEGRRRHLHLFGRRLPLPASRWARVSLGSGLVVGGVFGFLPILGFWMIPLGLVVLSVDFAPVRRLRRRSSVKAERWRRRRTETST
ncbi:hypothetical protein [Jiella marina]|uniref:hypothetical protein n=1 Tax=Jiella sp. LLJ827 TaxID=2917712 RepID=UPI0021007E7E|nr:hypothetical protein [Jiella sp. LLJ827]MCQ0988400.1 hypothetical protein [Jiella sp. LLJ827]